MTFDPVIRVSKSLVALHADEEPKTLWHWTYLDASGSLVDSSGPSRDGLASLGEVKAVVADKYPEVAVEVHVGEDDPDFKEWSKVRKLRRSRAKKEV